MSEREGILVDAAAVAHNEGHGPCDLATIGRTAQPRIRASLAGEKPPVRSALFRFGLVMGLSRARELV
ncbi:MAG: hypothetical protein JO124_18750 [Hyphomicrobiales bacterium]|nr:hypothetical protein [Hyphomicrobiales bacterium]